MKTHSRNVVIVKNYYGDTIHIKEHVYNWLKNLYLWLRDADTQVDDVPYLGNDDNLKLLSDLSSASKIYLPKLNAANVKVRYDTSLAFISSEGVQAKSDDSESNTDIRVYSNSGITACISEDHVAHSDYYISTTVYNSNKENRQNIMKDPRFRKVHTMPIRKTLGTGASMITFDFSKFRCVSKTVQTNSNENFDLDSLYYNSQATLCDPIDIF